MVKAYIAYNETGIWLRLTPSTGKKGDKNLVFEIDDTENRKLIQKLEKESMKIAIAQPNRIGTWYSREELENKQGVGEVVKPNWLKEEGVEIDLWREIVEKVGLDKINFEKAAEANREKQLQNNITSKKNKIPDTDSPQYIITPQTIEELNKSLNSFN
jgi:hypothetical protein